MLGLDAAGRGPRCAQAAQRACQHLSLSGGFGTSVAFPPHPRYHAHGYDSEKQLQRIHEVDVMLGDAYQAVCDAGIQDDTLFMMIADHGGWSDGEKLTTFACVGPTVQRCDIEEMNIRALAAIMLYALSIEAPEFSETGWTSQIPAGIFNDDTLPEYRDISHLAGGVPRISRGQHITEIVTEEEA